MELRTEETPVTYLEMRGRPTRPPAPRPLSKIALMHAEAPPLAFYRYLLETAGRPFIWSDRCAPTEDALAAVLSDPDTAIYVLYRRGIPVGFAELAAHRPTDAGREVEIVGVGLAPGARTPDLMDYLVDWAVECGWEQETSRVWTRACMYDLPQALARYQRAGFMPYRQQMETVIALSDIS